MHVERGRQGVEREEGGSKPYDSPYQLVEKGGKVLTDKSSPVSNCTYVMYNTTVGFSFSYLPFC
jgi:hypothetical protein